MQSVAASVVSGTALEAPTRRGRRFAVVARRVVGVALGAGLLAFGVIRYRASTRVPAVHYETVAIDEGAVDATVTATGAVSPLISVQVGSQVSGRIARLYADFGSSVARGQTVATIEPSLFLAAAAQARANLAAAFASAEKARAQKLQADRQRVRNEALLGQGLVSQADSDVTESAASVAVTEIASARASVAQARAALDQAELSLKYTTIVSPIDGIVISRNVDVGQTVAAALQAPTLFTIAQDLTKMQVDANVAEADVGRIQPGMTVSFMVDAYPGQAFSGVVRQVRDNAQTIQNVVTYDVVIDVDNAARLLKPGMTANVTLSYAKRNRALRVPQAAVRFKPDREALKLMLGAEHPALPTPQRDQRTLWILRGTTPTPVVVQVGVTDGSNAEVTAGSVRPGDRAVVEVVKPTP